MVLTRHLFLLSNMANKCPRNTITTIGVVCDTLIIFHNLVTLVVSLEDSSC